ncbi:MULTISPECIES: hypothetical protein [unclassified Rhizobium]|uniref:hypothetical protein n=1 Tax=unclassified Rhizobium TaxID=2613769 RepID=UPI000715770D|nr:MULTISPECIES: hypothetical protein [unclassified Rhizobium]KQS96359.1 hypothetical protein ASG50_04675 [Rhizobium sp. Leaf386]KQT06198.1 hypothetical protein ASG42_00920 [Rhizobium sp. Leaf391]KQU09567.1 hypothetical protein ASG68_00700 [Rhizobium sp. Leaf453]
MGAKEVGVIYLKSLGWILVAIASAVTIHLSLEVLIIDFIHENPNRPKSNAALMLVVTTPIFAVISSVLAALVLALPQSFEAFWTWLMARQVGVRGQFSPVFALPFTAVVTWYCYDYLTPSNMNLGINEGADWVPYEHGLTLSRYAAALACQAPVTLFNIGYLEARTRKAPKRCLVLMVLGLAVVIELIVRLSPLSNLSEIGAW